MATNNRITYTLDFKANFKDVQGQLNTLRQSLSSVAVSGVGADIKPNLQKASQAAIALQGHLKKALDPNTGRLDLSRLQTQLSASGQSAKVLGSNLLHGGKQGAQAFLQLSNAILNAQKPMHRFSQLSKSLWTSLKQAAKWHMSSAALTSFTSALSQTVTFAKELDTSLNAIRIVTGESRDQMNRFAIEANNAAKSLSVSTKAYADATLIYRQQGDTAAEAARKAEITMKAANASGVEAKEMSEYMTGIWNSYQVGANQLELFADKIVRVGAATASSTEEMATAMTKVAATANTVGVSYDQLLSTIATVTSATRLSAEQVGTAFKTIYARMGDLKLEGSIDEDGVTTTLGSVSSQLKQVGVDVLDANGNIRDMGMVVEDLGNRWSTMSLNQKTAITEAVAGKRQYTQLFALFDNWDKYSSTLSEATNAQGELNKQQSIYEDSIKGAQARFKAAKEDFLLDAGFGGETIQTFYDATAKIMEGLDGIVDAAGGIEPIFMMLTSHMMQKYAPQISQSLVDIGGGIISTLGLGQSKVEQIRADVQSLFAEAKNHPDFQDPMSQASIESMEAILEAQRTLEENAKNLNSIEKERYDLSLKLIKAKEEEAMATASANYKAAENQIKNNEAYLKNQYSNIAPDIVSTTQGTIDVSKIAEIADSQGIANISNIMNKIQASTGSAQVSFEAFVQQLYDSRILTSTEQMQNLSRAMTENHEVDESLIQSLRGLSEGYGNIEARANDLRNVVRNVIAALEQAGLIMKRTDDESTNADGVNKQAEAYKRLNENISQLNANQNKGKKDYSQDVELLKKEDVSLEELKNRRKELISHQKNIGKLKTDNLSETDIQNLNREKQVIKDLIGEYDIYIKKKEEANKNSPKTDWKAKMEGAVNTVGALSQGMMSLSMIMSSCNTLAKGEADAMGTVMAAGMLLSSTLSLLSALNKSQIKDYIALGVAKVFYNQQLKDETAAIIAQKGVIDAKTKSEIASKLVSKGALGVAIALAAAIAIGTVALVKHAKANSEGAKQAKKFAAAEKEVEKNTEKLGDLESKIEVFDSLREKLNDAALSATQLAEVEAELNKELGISIDLVNGGAEARARALGIVNASANATRQELEELKKLNEEKRQEAFSNLGLKTKDKDSLSREASFDMLKRFYDESEQAQEDFWGGTNSKKRYDTGTFLGNETITAGNLQEFLDNNEKYIADQIQNDILPYYSSSIAGRLQTTAVELLKTGYDPDLFLQAYKENYAEIEAAFISGDTDNLLSLLDKLFSEEDGTEQSKQVFQAFKQRILAMEKETSAQISASMDNTSKNISTSFAQLRKLSDASASLIEDFGKNGVLNTEKIAEFAKKLKEDIGYTAEQADKVEEALLNAKNATEIAQTIGAVTIDKVLSNKTLIDNIGDAKGFEQIVKIFSENNIVNARQLATEIKKNVMVAKELRDEYSDLRLDEIFTVSKNMKLNPAIIDSLSEDIKKLQTEYGYTVEAAHNLVVQETIFNNTKLNVSQKISALKSYISTMNLASNSGLGQLAAALPSGMNSINVKNLTQEQKDLFGIEGTDGKKALESVLQTYGANLQQWNYQIEMSSKAEKERAEAYKEYAKEIKEWNKENDIAKISDDIERLTNALTELSNTLSNKEFAVSLYGDDAVPLEYYTDQLPILQKQLETAKAQFQEIADKDSQYYEGSQEYLDALNERRQNYQDAVLKIEEVEQRIKEIKRDDEEFEQKELDLIDEAARSALEGISSLVSTIYDTVDKVLSASKELMELYDDDSITARQGAAAKLIGSMIGGTSAYSEEQKERAKSKKELKRKIEDFEEEKENRLRIKKEEFEEIIKEDKKMVDTISDYSSEVMEQGIAEREIERNLELAEIEKDYSDTVKNIAASVDSAIAVTQEKMNTLLQTALEVIKASSQMSGQEGYTAETYGNKIHRKSSTPGDLSLENFTKSAAGYRVVALDEDNGRVVIESFDVEGNAIDQFDYDISGKGKAKTGSLDKDLIDRWNKRGKSNSINIEAGDRIIQQAKDVYSTKISTTGVDSSKVKWSEDQAITAGVNPALIGPFKVDHDAKSIRNGHGAKIGYFTNEKGDPLTPLGYGSRKFNNLNDLKKEVEKSEDLELVIEGLAKGTKHTKAGAAFVGEKGRELILLPNGKVVIAGEDGIELANLPEGAEVIPNDRTEEILRNKKDYTISSGAQQALNGYADGIGETPILETEDLTEAFHEKELKEQEEQNKKITESLKKRNEEINKNEEKYHSTSLQNTESHQSKVLSKTVAHEGRILSNANTTNTALTTGASLTASAVEGFINNMKFVLPRIDSEEFLDSLDKAIKDAIELAKAEREENGDIKSSQTAPSSVPGPGGKEYDFVSKYGGTGILKKNGTQYNVRIGQGNTTYDDLFVKYGQKYGVPPELLKTIAAGESGFTPNIDNISGSGAQGMMQFMPSTSRLLGIKNPYDANEAVEGAAKALGTNYQKTNSWYKSLNMYGQGSYNKKHQYLDKIIDTLGEFDGAQVEDIEFVGSSFSDLLTEIATKGIESIVKIPSSLDGDLTRTQITELSQNGWIDPVLGKFPVTSEFGKWRTGSKGPYQHGGIDIGAPQGTPLYATKSGVVVINQNDAGGYGHWIKIKTDDGYIIGYGHMREASPYKIGTRVSQGQVIGYVGNTGRSKGPHLDYHVLSPEGSSINPRSIMPGYARGGRITSSEKALVGEYGKEIILYPDGTAGLLGVNGMEYADLPAGAQIIPNEETEKILNNPVDYKNSSNKLNAHALGSGIYSDKEIEMAWKVLEGMAKHNSSPEALTNWTLNPYSDADQKSLMALAGYENNDAQFYALSVSYMRELQKLPTATLNYLQSMIQEKYPGMSTGMPGEVNSELIHSLMAIQEANNYESIVHPLIEFFGEDYVAAMKNLEKLKSTDYSARKYEDEYKTKLNAWMSDNFGQEKIAEAIKLYSDPTNPNFFLESSRIAAENNQKIVEFAQGELDSLIADYQDYLAQVELTGEKNEAFETYISEAITKAGEALTQAAEDAKQYAETLHNVREEELEHIKNLDTAMGRYNATVEATIAKKRLDNLLLYEPEDIEEIYQAQTEYQAALLAELQAQLDVINRYYEDKIEDTEKRVQRLTGYLNITQSYYDEFNSYEEGLHEINKQLTESKIKTEWFDKKTKEMLFNEKDYLVISTKIFELQQDALDDREATKELIENLSEDELYMTESINAAYKERVEMRKKELDLLKTTITLQDKQAALNDALMNRNVRVFSGGRWIQIANVETVSQAQRDFEETKYQISKKQAEMDQLEDINTQNENIRELNDNIKEWQETMKLAAKYLEEAEIGLTEQVSLSGTSLESFREAVDTTVTKIIDARDKLTNLGYDNYDKNSIKSQLEILAEELYDAKVLYENAKDDATRNLASQDAARIRQKAYDLTGNKDALSWGSEYNASQFLASQGKTIADLINSSAINSWGTDTVKKQSSTVTVVNLPWGGERRVTFKNNENGSPAIGWVKKVIGGNTYLYAKYADGSIAEKAFASKLGAYATGTRDSKPGLSWINEKGIEMLSTPYGQLIELSPHQKIFNNEQLNYLYDISKQGLQGMTAGLSSISNNSNSITISDLNIALDNVTDAESFVTELQGLTRYIRNVKTIKRNS